ncbi:MAG: hypothetical protein M3459_11185 [Actinomycetota bacterium]|nr:hypothetical protein [Actinomycetota bacterium]
MRRTLTLLLAAGSLGIAACGGDEEETTAPPADSGATQMTEPAQPEPVADIEMLTGVDTAVALDAGFVEALESLELTPAAVGDGEITEGGSAVFPITGGNVTYFEPGTVSPYVQGLIEHEGSGLSLTSADGTVVELTDFEVDPGASELTGTVTVDGEVAAESAPLFFLDGGTLEPLEVMEADGTAVLQGTTVELKAEAAEVLNDIFGVDALEEGLTIGTATITVELPEG